MKKVGFMATMVTGAVIMTCVLSGGYKVIRFGFLAAHLYDPAAKIEAAADASAPLLRTIGGQ